MIQIRNISKGRPNEARVATRVGYDDSGGAIPMFIDLAPGETLEVPAQSVSDWLPGVKQWLAEYVANGLLKVFTIDSVHDYRDKNHNAEYGLDYLIGAQFGTLALNHAIAMATSFNTEMQLHYDDDAVHGANVGTLSAAIPTNLATLITWIGDAQTQYAAHIVSGAAHATADTWNTIAPVGAVDLATSISALQELWTAYHSHKTWLDHSSAAEMTITTLLAY